MFDQAIISKPFIQELKIHNEHIALVLGCDGLYEILDNISIRNIIFEGLKNNDSLSEINNTLIN